MKKMVEKVDLPTIGEFYVACAEDVSLESMQALQEPLKKLYEYEQEEENGTLVHLPCKKVYFVVDQGKETAIVMSKDIEDLAIYRTSEIDKDGIYWSTKEKAEQHLKEMEESKNGKET